jgi:RNA polymerase sigma factor (sigma-70 family)
MGDRFEELCIAFRDRLIGTLVRFGRSPADAEDLAHDALLSVRPRLDRVQPGCEWAYLRMAARNLAINQATRRDRPPPEPEREPPQSAEQAAINNEFAAAFRAVMDELPPETRQIVTLKRRGDGFPEIARKLNMTPDAVRSRMSRAAKLLRERLGTPPPGTGWMENDDDHER